jgi:NAD(P)-dependent dehydrogenase (short-subunit alcohol dehydrogenase family)
MTSSDRNPVLVVTGATSGMGRAIALQAAEAGYQVVATGRDGERMEDLGKVAAERGVQLDVRFLEITDHPAVRALIDAVADEYGGIDALLSQAGGIFALGTLEQMTIDGFRFVMETNFFGNLALVKAALPHLRASHGHLIVTTSANGLMGAPYNDAYAASKFALEGAIESLAPVVADFGVRTTIVEPGPVATDVMAPRRLERLLPNDKVDNSPYPEPWDFLTRVIASGGGVQLAEDVGQQVLELLAMDKPPLRFLTTDWARDFARPKLAADLDGQGAYGAGRAYVARAR